MAKRRLSRKALCAAGRKLSKKRKKSLKAAGRALVRKYC